MKYTLLALVMVSNPVNLDPVVPKMEPKKPLATCAECVIVHYQTGD